MSRLLVLFVAAALGAAGCSGTGPYPVSGQVVYDDGKPATELNDWMVVFDNAETRMSSTGSIDAEGRYTLDFRKRGDGALPGTYKVLIYDPAYLGGGDDLGDNEAAKKPKSKRRLSSKYNSIAQTPLTATVEPKKNDITLTVSR